MNQRIFLVGFMGVGKSTVARIISKKTGITYYETDDEVIKSVDMKISDIFRFYGEEYFRDLETKVCSELAEKEPAVISCGGGIVLREENVAIMKNAGTTVLLTATPESIFERVKDSEERPVLNGHMNEEYIKKLMSKRIKSYKAAADLEVSTDNRTPEEVADEVIRLLL